MIAFKDKLAVLLARAKAQVKAGTAKDQLVAAMKLDDLWTFPADQSDGDPACSPERHLRYALHDQAGRQDRATGAQRPRPYRC